MKKIAAQSFTSNVFYATLIIAALFNTTTYAQPNQGLDVFIQSTLNLTHIPGLAATFIKDGKIAWSKGYGYADIEKDIPFTPNTISSHIGSISKTVTATALMKLWEQGLFQLDDDINNYLPFQVRNPYYPNIPITFRMLLQEKSSLKQPGYHFILNFDHYSSNSYYNSVPNYGAPGSNESLGSFLQNLYTPGGTHYQDTLSFFNYAPGSQFNHANYGYALLGYLVERISGIPFNQYCNQHIFQPLCMNNTGWHFNEIDTNIVSRPYHFSNGKQLDYGLIEYPDYPDGQLKTSAVDLSKFLLMHMNYGILDGVRILDSATVALMRTKAELLRYSDFVTIYYGYGWEYHQVHYGNDDELWGQNGEDAGACTGMHHNISDRTGTVVLSNGDSAQQFGVIGYPDPMVTLNISDIMANISTNTHPDLNCLYTSNPCEHSLVYWKNELVQWTINSVPMRLGTKHYYNQSQLLDLINLLDKADASIVLAKALIAAKLNVAQGSELSPIVITINTAMNLIGDRHLPLDAPISFTSSTGVQMLALAVTLNSYNSGNLNTNPCSGTLPSVTSKNVTNEIENITNGYSLSVYPNPFSAFSTILFTIPLKSKVTIGIFDLCGRLIATLANKEMEAGMYGIKWSVNNEKENAVPSGIYFLKMNAGSYSATKKLSVIK